MAASLPEPTRSLQPLSGTNRAPTILVIEDEAIVREVVQKTLEQSGYRVLGAGGGNEALDLCESSATPIDLVLTDIVMPGTSGTDLAGYLALRGMGVILTGMGSDGALGMKAIRDAGGWTIGQDAENCTVYGMPRSAAEMNALCRVAPLHQIASEIKTAFPLRTGIAPSFAARSHAR